MKRTHQEIRRYLSGIGRRGGLKSRRHLDPETARDMVRVREARRAFAKYRATCFWYMKDDLKIHIADVPEIAEGLRRNGGREGFLLAGRLCR